MIFTLKDLNCVTSVTINKMLRNYLGGTILIDGEYARNIDSPEMIMLSKIHEILIKKHDDFTTEVVLADKRKIEIEEDNYYTFYYTKKDLKDVDKYIEWIKSVV